MANGATTEFVFNASGERVSEWNAATHAQLQGNYYWQGKPLAYYTTAADTSSAVGIHFEHQNYLGTERMRTMPTGPYNSSSPNYAVEATFAEQPFGDNKLTIPTGAPDTDANHYAFLDTDKETATDHADFRQYSNAQGRWMAPDPYDGSYDPSNPQSLNRYVYAMNSPLNYLDPSGESVLLCAEGGDCYWLTDQQYLDALGSSNSGMYVPSLSELKREGTLSIMGTGAYNGVEGTVSYFNDLGLTYDASTPGQPSNSNPQQQNQPNAPNNGAQPKQPTTPPKDWCQFYKTTINVDTDLLWLAGGGWAGASTSSSALLKAAAPEMAVVAAGIFVDRAISRYGGNWEHGCHN